MRRITRHRSRCVSCTSVTRSGAVERNHFRKAQGASAEAPVETTVEIPKGCENPTRDGKSCQGPGGRADWWERAFAWPWTPTRRSYLFLLTVCAPPFEPRAAAPRSPWSVGAAAMRPGVVAHSPGYLLRMRPQAEEPKRVEIPVRGSRRVASRRVAPRRVASATSRRRAD